MSKFLLGILIFIAGPFASALPDTGLNLVTGKKISFDIEQKDSYKVVLFYNSECPCSKAHFDHLKSLSSSHPKMKFFGFHANKYADEKQARAYFSQFKINFPIVQDTGLRYTDKLKALKTPHAFVFDKNNKLVYQGGVTDSRDASDAEVFYLKEVLAALNSGKPSPYSEIKTLGCYIRR